MHIFMSDYPYFDGTAYAWPGVKEKFQALLEAQVLDELVNIKYEDAPGFNIYVR